MLNSTIYTDNQSIINYNLFFQQNNFFIKKVIINILTIELKINKNKYLFFLNIFLFEII